MYSLKNKKIGIFGLGVTGLSIYSDIKFKTKNIICWDDSEKNRINFQDQEILLDLSNEKWQSIDTVFISPGVPSNHQIFLLAKRHNILISSDIELFIHNNPHSKIIAITGTNGKSTTTALIGHILNSCGYDFPIGGNIGTPALSLPKNKTGYVLELSSFQLDLISFFNPTISVLLNITPDHIDRHGTFDEYCKAKMRIFRGDGIKIIGIDSNICREIYDTLISKGEKNIISIGSGKNKNSISYADDSIHDDFYDASSYKIPELHNLIGRHNKENIVAAYAVCRSLGLKPNEIINQLNSFQGLKHRMQNLGSKNNITYFNDSKATNASSAAGSLSSMKNIFWLAGGIFKEESLDPLEKSLQNVKKAYLFGESSLLFSKYLKNKIDFEVFSTMQEAFSKANREAKKAKEQAYVILAPACASFDQFKNFEDRGDQFIDLCNEELQ